MRIPLTLFISSIAILLSTASCFSHQSLNPVPNSIITVAPTLRPDPSATPTVATAVDTITGSFRNQIGILEDNMPRANSEGYVVPTNQEQAAFAHLVSAIEAGDLINAVRLAGENHYTLNYYVDRGDENALSYLLREMKPIQKGWGLYAIRIDSTSNIIIEAPHPLYDKNTPSVALDIYRALNAHALLIAGAQRHANSDGAADVAHAPESIFQVVHKALAQEIQTRSGNVIILQIHGFHTTKHADYPRVVIGSGKKLQTQELALAQEINDALSAQGVSVGVCTGNVWQELCGETNTQASTVTNGGVFLHMELDEDLRKHDDVLIISLLQVFGK